MKLEKIKEIIKSNYKDAQCGCFFTRNIMCDPMTTIYRDAEITIDICYRYGYFEIFGLSYAEEEEVIKYYESLQKSN